MIKLICTDIDGTLVPEGGDRMPEEYFDVIRALRKKGIRMAAASGRQYASLRQLFDPVGDELIYAAEGGCLLMHKGEVLDAAVLPFETVLDLSRDIGNIPGCFALLSAPEASFCLRSADDLYHKMKDEYHYEIHKVKNWEEISEKNIIKISLFRKDGKAEEIEGNIPERWRNNPHISYACSGYQWYDFYNRESDKGYAVKKMQKLWKISPEETVAFGDNMNDIPMFRVVGVSYAVAGASDEVKTAATGIVKAMEEKGVWIKLQEILEHLP